MKKILIYISMLILLVSFSLAACNFNGICEPGENILNCPDDCGAVGGYCGDGFCDVHEIGFCPEDCGDVCIPTNGGVEICDGRDNNCNGLIDDGLLITCESNNDCGLNGWIGAPNCLNGNVWQDYRTFSCINPGHCSSKCESHDSFQLKQECSNGCFNGACSNIVCNYDSDCNDGNNMTIDKCNNPGLTTSYCSYTPVTIYGQVIDTINGTPQAGINVSFYNSNIYNPYDGTGDFEALTPKEIPDAVTDENGYYYASLVDGVYHLVFQGSIEIDFSYYHDDSLNIHNAQINRNKKNTIFNSEGHILYSNKYKQGNKYLCGETLRFTMFGVNNGATDETITFLVKDHTTMGGPNAPNIYYGDINNPSESLTVPAGEKIWKEFSFNIPCSYDLGRYAIHVVWNDEQWHLIGNFFIIEDTTPPVINSDPYAWTFTQEPVQVFFSAYQPPQPGTVRAYEIGIMGPDEDLEVLVYKDILVDEFDINTVSSDNADFVTSGGFNNVLLNYSESGYYTARFVVKDFSGNIAYSDTNITVYITEEEANVIGEAIYEEFGIKFDLRFNEDVSSSPSIPAWNLNVDRWEHISRIGDEYLTPNDGFNSTVIASLDKVVYEGLGPNYIKAIDLSTAEEYNKSLSSYLTLLKCVHNDFGSGPSCDYRNFAPVIWKYTPNEDEVTISSDSSQAFSVSVVDPNNDSFSCHWYENDEFLTSGSCSYLYEGDESKIGVHHIKVIAEDIHGASSSHTWKLTIN